MTPVTLTQAPPARPSTTSARKPSTALPCTRLPLALSLGGLVLAVAAPARADDQIQIPLQYTYTYDAEAGAYSINRLTIQLGTDKTTSRVYIFDTGSTALVGQVDVPYDPGAPRSVAAYGDGTYGNLVQDVTLQGLYYKDADGNVKSFAGSPVVSNSLFRVYAYGSAYYNENLEKGNVSAEPVYVDGAGTKWYADLESVEAVKNGQPAESDGTYGIFGAGDFIDRGDAYNAIGATTRTGYVISANANVAYSNTPATAGCAPCVTLNLNSSLRSQFDSLLSWNAAHGDIFQPTFPVSGANASSQMEGNYTYEFRFVKADGSAETVTVTGPALLDTGTPMEVLLSGADVVKQLNDNGLDLGPNTQKDITSVTITAPDGGKMTLPQATLLRLGTDEAGPGVTIGLPFFYQQSVMYDLENRTTGFTPYFVTASSFTTDTPGAGELGLSRITPEMGSQMDDGSGKLGLAGVVSGSGDLTIAARADVRMTGVNTYTGATIIERDAALYLAGPGSIAQSRRVVADGWFDISRHGNFNPLWGVSDAGNDAAIRSLAGSGTVQLGSRNLVLTDAGDVFSGRIMDLDADDKGLGGGLIVAGGTQTLSGKNDYSGRTVINAGAGLLLAESGSLVSDVVVAGRFGNDGRVDAGTLVTAGGVLGGMGSMTDVTMAGGGVVAPGSALDAGKPVAVLQVSGDFMQQAGSTYRAGLSFAADLIEIGGTATLENGANIELVREGDRQVALDTPYTLLTAAQGLNGSYGLAGGWPPARPSSISS